MPTREHQKRPFRKLALIFRCGNGRDHVTIARLINQVRIQEFVQGRRPEKVKFGQG